MQGTRQVKNSKKNGKFSQKKAKNAGFSRELSHFPLQKVIECNAL